MGEDLKLPGREAIRTPMQWDDTANAGFSSAARDQLIRPVPNRGSFGYRRVNVRAQQQDAGSLLRWFEAMIGALRECPEIGVGTPAVLDMPLPRSVLVHRFDAPEGSIVFVHNLAEAPVRVDLGAVDGITGAYQVFGDADYGPVHRGELASRLNGWGYCWLRLRRG